MPSLSDPLAELRRLYLDQLPVRLATIRAHYRNLTPLAWQPAAAEVLHRLLHGITGSAGTFGLLSVSAAAHQMEVQLAALLQTGAAPGEVEWLAIGAELERIEQLARVRLESGAPSLKQPTAFPRLDRSPLIYLVEDDSAQAEHMSQALRDDGYRVRVFRTPTEFRACSVVAAADAERPAALVMDMAFPEGDTAGADLLAELKVSGPCPPVVFVSVHDDMPARLAALRAGACRYMVKPVEPGRLIGLLDTLTGRLPPQPYRVLLVDDDVLLLETHAAILRAAGLEVRALSQPLQILDELNGFAPDVVLLDVYMPEASGPELAAVLRERDEQLQLPILFLSAEADMSQQLLALNLGGDDFLVKPVQPDYLVEAVVGRARRARQSRAIQQHLELSLYEREREHLALDHHALVSISDQEGSITYVNNKFCEASGYSRGELLGQNHRIIKSGEHSQAFYQKLWHTIARGEVWMGAMCNRRKDGSLYWVETTITPFLDDNGMPYQYVSIRTDISHVKAAEASAAVYKERLRRGQVFGNIGTWEWNILSGDLYWSERIAPLFGYANGELETSYDNFLAAIHPDDRQAVIDAVNACLERDVPYEIEHRVVWPDGTVHWMLERGDVVRDADGKPMQMLGVVQDINDQKMSKIALGESQARLADANRMLQLVLDHIPVRVFWKNTWLRYMGCNKAFALDAGRQEPEEIIGLDDLSMPWSREAEAYRRDDRNVIESRTPKLDYEEGQTTVAGEHVWVSTSKIPLLGPDGRAIGVMGVYTDITARKRAEQALIAARDEADRASRAKSEFLSNMSHELRTPMNAILGFGQLMEYDPTLPDEHKDNVREILKGGHHLLQLINEVLDLTKVESGRIDLSLEPVEVCPIINECLSLVGTLADKRGIQLSHTGLKEVAVRADRTRLKQTLLNLLSNAIKYNREGGSVQIEVQAEGADRLRIRVTDTGPGIPTPRLAELFQPFNRLGAEATEIEGTGIGLTITRRIVEMMGGAVDVESEVGVGSCFWIELPLESLRDVDHRHEGATTDSAAPDLHVETVQHTVLYVEDNPSNLKLVAQILGRRQHIHLLTAHTPELGIELALTRHPKLILLDINMPGMDGYQLLSVLKAEASLKAVPVVAITANAMPRDIERGKIAGFADYLTKPLDVERFSAVIDRLLGIKHADEPRREA
ncbi:MAG: response regulator [Thiobacillus sp.]|nr:response regulator [Thiobacillus sp.]